MRLMKDRSAARRGRRFSLSRTLTVGLTALFLASLGASLWVAFDVAQRNTFELERALAELTVEAAIREVDTHLGAAQKQIEFLDTMIERGDIDPRDDDRLRALVTGALAAAPQVSGIAFVRADFSVVRVGRTDEVVFSLGGNWADRDDIRLSMERAAELQDPGWRGIDWIEEFRSPHVIVSEPVMRGDDLLGLLFSIVSIGALSEFLAGFDKANETRSFILYGRDRVLAHPVLANGFAGLSRAKMLPGLDEVSDHGLAAIWGEVIDDLAYLLGDSPVSGHVVAGQDDDYVYFYRELDVHGDSPWLVGVHFRGSEVDEPVRRLIFALGFGLATLVLAIICGLLLARSIVRPMDRLVDASETVSRLELDRVPTLRGSVFKELDVAIRAFESMVAGLRWFETYVPRSLVLRLMASGGATVTSEERVVTVLFTDLAGFTQIGSQLRAEQLANMLNDHFTLLAKAIEDEQGTVDKYIGDSIMAFWGAPLEQPDHATRACRAAHQIARRMRRENARRRAAGEQPLGLRVGLHSGPAVVGNIGAPGRVNYTLIGDTVNTAQRLEGLGKEVCPGAEVTVLLSADTVAMLDGDIRATSVGDYVLRGRVEPLEVYKLDLEADQSSG